VLTRRPIRLPRQAGLLAMLTLVACAAEGTGPDSRDAVDREAFIASFVDLRVAALLSEDGHLTDDSRIEVLSSHGVTEGDLTVFVEVHGRDLDFMREVWNEVEIRLEERRLPGEDLGDPVAN